MLNFFVCEVCGNMVEMLHSSGAKMMCCGQEMTELIPGTTDASVEKHVPVCETNGDTLTVTIGEIEHPMEDVHYIQWIALKTDHGAQITYLHPGNAPKTVFFTPPEERIIAVYAYCNKHGLWTTELK